MGGLEDALTRIEELLIDLPDEPETATGLMREHLMGAHYCLLASMVEEYVVILRQARQLLPQVTDRDLRVRIGAFLRSQHFHSYHEAA